MENLIEKIAQKSKEIRLSKMLAYHNSKTSSVPYEASIVKNDTYGGYYLIQKCMIFSRQSFSDSEYCIYEFDEQGDFKRQRNDLAVFDFFKTNRLIKNILF